MKWMGWIVLALAIAGFMAACSDDDDDALIADDGEFDASLTIAADPNAGPGDDDDSGDDDDREPIPPATPNPDAKADAFRLFYRERVQRMNVAWNRFLLAGDSAAGTTFGKSYVARSGDEFEVVPGPNDNNEIGVSPHSTWKLYQSLGGRSLELTLIRMFEGLNFNERVSGHDGLTNREALPGWTRVMDGVNDTITRTRFGEPIESPNPFDPALEQEILDTFYDGVSVTYRENPGEYMYNFKAINELPEFAVTFVFSPADRFIRVSNCCSSFMISKRGMWEGAYWGNHNSRDNFTDYVQGYLAAFDAERTEGLPDDLAEAAHHAADAARRTGDRIVSDGMIQMTVDEWHDYDTLIPGGQRRPDGTTEWQDLGSLSSCQMVYAAQAISSEGLSWPVPELPLPGAIERSALQLLFDLLGLDLEPPDYTCTSLDDAFIGRGWGDILHAEILGMPWYELAEIVARLDPDIWFRLLGGMMDDFRELVLGAVNICTYAQIVEDDEMYDEARQSLWNLIQFQRIFAHLLYELPNDPATRATLDETLGAEFVDEALNEAGRMRYLAATYARRFNIDAPIEDFAHFQWGIDEGNRIEGYDSRGDTAPWPLVTDDEIAAQVEAKLAGKEEWIVERYRERFGFTYPVRRDGDGYEAIGPDGEWQTVKNSRHQWMGGYRLWFGADLCVDSPITLDCTWAALGCAPVDLDGSGTADAADTALFETAWSLYGEGADCSDENADCDGADLDASGTLDAEDRAYLEAAQGCRT